MELFADMTGEASGSKGVAQTSAIDSIVQQILAGATSVDKMDDMSKANEMIDKALERGDKFCEGDNEDQHRRKDLNKVNLQFTFFSICLSNMQIFPFLSCSYLIWSILFAERNGSHCCR